MPWPAGASGLVMRLPTKWRWSKLSATSPASWRARSSWKPTLRSRYDQVRPGVLRWRRRGRPLASVDPDHPPFFDRQCQPSLFQRQGGFAKQLAAPAVQRADVGMIVSRDLFQIVDGCDQLAGDGVAFRCHPQQNFQKLDDRSTV